MSVQTATDRKDVVETVQPALKVETVVWLLVSVVAGVMLAVLVLPLWLPALSGSVTGAEPKVYWYLSRSSAFVAFGLLWASMALGLGITNKLARMWPGAPTAFDLHQYTSLLGLAFGLFHGLILLGDQYIGYNLFQVLVPFAGGDYRPAWVGLGQISLYGLAVVGFSFYFRKRIGNRTWRMIHFISFAVFGMALVHGIMSGTDSGSLWTSVLYWVSAASLVFLTVYRVAITRSAAPRTA